MKDFNMVNLRKNASKADTLLFLKNRVKQSSIEDLYVFTVSDWMKNKQKILESIKQMFHSNVVIRSSAIGEDSEKASLAGRYDSILNVNPSNSKTVKKTVGQVIDSYSLDGNISLMNQVIVQNQVLDAAISGVIFTRIPDLGAPYYVINYDKGPSTESVTKGKIGNMIKIFRDIDHKKLSKNWSKLIKSVKEVEQILKSTNLDVEFCITSSGKIKLFQARPIVSNITIPVTKLDKKVTNQIAKNKARFKSQHDSATIFSDMADWNPSEIIGNNPNFLDYSLYDYLIMKDSWHKGRKKIGYYDLKNSNLMQKFGNKPYVDIKASFNSLTPKNIPASLRKKLVNYYVEKLKQNPSLHDKVEFEIVFSCYDYSTDDRLRELEKYGFSREQVSHVKGCLIKFTNQVVENFPLTVNEALEYLQRLKRNHNYLINSVKNESDYGKLLGFAEKLLNDCKKLGIIPFVTVARIAFIASTLLKSLVKSNSISSKMYDSYMRSIETPLSDLQNDLYELSAKKITKSRFLKKYGHLRPGTYDITQTRYDMGNTFFNNIEFRKPTGNTIPHIKKIQQKIPSDELQFASCDLDFFIRRSLELREELKFHFTKNLSDALEFIAKAGILLGFSRVDLANLTINDILKDYKKYAKQELQRKWKEKIEKNKHKKYVNNHLVLPPLVKSERDFEIIEYYSSKPNYITLKSVTSKIVFLKSITKRIPDLENCIVLMENADPGYDWIFTKNPSGLITKYGGAASHMAIRCSEMDLPAAIGCGEVLFEKIKDSEKLLLDCENQQIIILERKKHDEIIEVKKTLKSLGYIK